MSRQILSRLLHRLRLRAPRASLEEWERHHRPTVEREVERLLPHVPEEGLFIDVGANLGLFAECLFAARPRARGWLFEPVAELHERCRQRFEGDPRIVLEPFGLADRAGRATIWKARYNPGGNSLVEELMFDRREVSEVTPRSVHDPETIELRVFDDYAREHGIERVDLIKTDTEGFDHRVLAGMMGFLEGCEPKPVILSELLEEGYHPHWEQQMAVVRRLYELGYGEVDLSRMKKVDDILFLPVARAGG